jgi:hypothetical protein
MLLNYKYIQQLPSNVHLKIFCDEIITEEWIYLGALIVPYEIEEKLLHDLLNLRCGNPKRDWEWASCSPQCSYHKKNDTEVHYQEVEKSKNKFYVAQKWIKYILNDRNLTCFYILGIDLKRLNISLFGQSKQQNAIYNRFFRTAILKSLKIYFSRNSEIVADSIYHDNNKGLETNQYFPWHSIFKIDKDADKIKFSEKNITFIDSDHRVSQNAYSHLIQLIDLILGCTFCCLEYSTDNEDKIELANSFFPLIQRLIDYPNNEKSQYNYVGRMKIEFFPKYDIKKLDENSLEYKFKKMDAFYTKRYLKILEKNQTRLF